MLASALATPLKRYGFDDSDPILWSLNSAMWDVLNYMDWDWTFNRATNLTMGPADTGLQNVPTDLFKIASLRNIENQAKLTEVEPHIWDDTISNPNQRGAPSHYCVVASHLLIWPLANVASTFSLFYQRSFADMATLSDQPCNNLMPANLQRLLVPGAAAKLLQMENEEERSAVAKQEFTDGLMAAASYDTRSLDSFQTVKDTMGYGLDYS